jgi:hypothetical protein
MGLHGTALLIGGAASAPLAGLIIDSHGPAWAFAGAGAVSVAMAAVALPFWRRRPAAEPVRVAEEPPVKVAAG